MKAHIKKILALSALCLLLVLISQATARGQAPTPQQSKTWAVAIGVSKYPRLPGGQQLQFAERDAIAFADGMKRSGATSENIRLLVGADATVSAIKSALGNWVARNAAETDTVIVFFSGHGLYEREYNQSYLLAYDSDVKDPFATALSLSELKQALATRIRSGRVLILADAVRRDLFDPETDRSSTESFISSFKELSDSRNGVSAILASSPGEFSREGQRWGGHGVFARHLLDSMGASADRNNDGAVAVDELFISLSARVIEDTSSKQHPWLTGARSDQFVIARVERQPSAPALSATTAPVIERPVASRENQAQPKVEQQAVQPKEREQISLKPSSTPASVNAANAQSQGEKKQAPQQGSNANDIEKTTNVTAENKSEPAIKQEPVATTSVAPKSETVQARKTAPPSPIATPSSDAVAINSTNRDVRPAVTPPINESDAAGIPPAPKPRVPLPTAGSVNPLPTETRPVATTAEAPSVPIGSSSPSVLLQIEAAIYAKDLIEPKNSSAWDLYQRAASDPAMTSDLARLKPMLSEALVSYGRSIVGGDVRADNITDKVDDFRKAGQVFVRARSLEPSNADMLALEKLSAAQALIALQFYDEAERALSQLQGVRLAALENTMGLIHQGKLDSFRAERAFKRAIEMDAKWAAPHYNLALLYRGQQNESALEEFERAALLDSQNVAVLLALGDEYFAKQQWPRAAEVYKKAIAVKPSDSLHTKLGHALFSQGLQQEADREYQKAREMRGKP